MKYLLGTIAAAVIAINPVAAAPETPLGFLFQSLDPRNFAAPPAPWNLSQARAPRVHQTAPGSYGRARQSYEPVGFPGLRYPNSGRTHDANRRVAPTPVSRQPATQDNSIYLQRTIVAATFNYDPGTVVIDTDSRFLYLMMENGQALRYGVGVGRQGFEWSGEASVGRKAEWPVWVPPADMREREPWLPERVEGGEDNPLGARALYLYQGSKDTLYRIHGTNQPETIGQALSSGCIRMLNDDVMDLYRRVPKGSKVVVL